MPDEKANTTHQAIAGDERFGLLYSDGGIGILTPGTMEDARREREFVDHNDKDPTGWTKIIRLTIPTYVVVEDPGAGLSSPPPSELDALKAEVARLQALVGEAADA
jgi:hypothetical protein